MKFRLGRLILLITLVSRKLRLGKVLETYGCTKFYKIEWVYYYRLFFEIERKLPHKCQIIPCVIYNAVEVKLLSQSENAYKNTNEFEILLISCQYRCIKMYAYLFWKFDLPPLYRSPFQLIQLRDTLFFYAWASFIWEIFLKSL